jgi:nicotinamidase-related amidase
MDNTQERTTEQILEEYRRRGLGHRVGYGQTPAVIVIDFIKGFTAPESPLGANYDLEVKETCRLLRTARHYHCPVFFTTTSYGPELQEAGLFIKKVPSLAMLLRDSEWIQLDPRLKRRSNEVLIEKHYASAFFGTSLHSMLLVSGVDTLIVVGCTTSGCVRATVVDAMQLGFRPIVPSECVGDRAPEAHRCNLLDIDSKYGDVMPIAEVISALRYPDREDGSR